MRYYIFLLVSLLAICGCKKDSGIINPDSNTTASDSKVKDSILYNFSVSKDKLGIFDTLNMTLTAMNQSSNS